MRKNQTIGLLAAVAAMFVTANATSYETGADAPAFVNYETPHVSPIAMTPDGTKLLAVNTADNRLMVFSLTGSQPVLLSSIPVGLDPVSVRAFSNTEAWVVNTISDSISVVNLTTFNVTRTIRTGDQPRDVVFAGTPARAFVSLSQENEVAVYDPANPGAAPTVVPILGKNPRAMAVSPDGKTVYVAVFSSGNKSTIITVHAAPNAVSDLNGPYGGQNPPPNLGTMFSPLNNPDITFAPPKVGIIVRKDAAGRWMDGNSNGDWTDFISGARADRSARIAGWDMVDNDVAAIDATSLSVTYLTGMMNLNMALAVKPNGQVTVVGKEATNEVRFEPNLKARFVRVKMASGTVAAPNLPTVVDLNPHLDYSDAQIAQQADASTFSQALVDQSIGDPRAIKWLSTGRRAYIAGMGSNSVIAVDGLGARVANIKVGEGPTGIASDEVRRRIYVLNKFGGSITVISTQTNLVQSTVSFFDPTPAEIKLGRKFLYDSHFSSGLGQASCASCHVDAKSDLIAWDLGNPAGTSTAFAPALRNCGFGLETPRECHDYHPMKGPLLTQTLQDIIGHEPFHWRGDKLSLREFNPAFTGLQGRPSQITDSEMTQFQDFLATIHYPPSPYRNFDNSLPTSVDLSKHESFGKFADAGGTPAGAPLPPGNAVNGLDLYRTLPAHISGPGGSPTRSNPCVMCHTLPTGLGADVTFVGDRLTFPAPGSGTFVDNAPGANGERHLMITGLGFGAALPLQVNTLKVPTLRALYEKRGFALKSSPSLSGFGYFQDGGDPLSKFIGRFPGVVNEQQMLDLMAFIMAFDGSDLPRGTHQTLEEPPGPLGKDAHTAVGYQITFNGTNNSDSALLDKMSQILSMADAGNIAVVAQGILSTRQRGWAYVGGGTMQSDRAGQIITVDSLRSGARAGAEITFTVVPKGSETRIGIDRDLDGILDADDSSIAVAANTALKSSSLPGRTKR